MFPSVDITNALPPDSFRRKQSQAVLPQYHTARNNNCALDGNSGIALTPSRCSTYIILGEDWRSRWAEFRIDFRIFYCKYRSWLKLASLLIFCTALTHGTPSVRHTSPSHQLHPFPAIIASNSASHTGFVYVSRPVPILHSNSNVSSGLGNVTEYVPGPQSSLTPHDETVSLLSWFSRDCRAILTHAHTFAAVCRSHLLQASRAVLRVVSDEYRFVQKRGAQNIRHNA